MWLGILAIILLFAFIQFKEYVDKKRASYVSEHSTAIKSIIEINQKHTFKKVPNLDMEHNYDNEDFYQSISPKDYLTYQLVYKAPSVKSAIKDARENKRLYGLYKSQINTCCCLGNIDIERQAEDTFWLKLKKLLITDYVLNKERLIETELKVFNSLIANPKTSFAIIVTLRRTNINGRLLTYKSQKFEEEAIEEILSKLSLKHNGRYLNDDIWQTICQVERGRVSNKMRFSIYERDGHRCRKCGRYSNHLEIDHIFPISKGGKSEYNNLQTLCHECNSKKSNTVERGAVNPKSKWQNVDVYCELCGAPMVIVNGKYGEFYGCPNYPKCRFTKKK